MTFARCLTLTLTVTALAGAPLAARTAAPASRTLTASLPAAALTHLDLIALDGEVDLKAASDPAAATIEISVTIAPQTPRLGHKARTIDLETVALDLNVDRNIAHVGLKNAAEGNVEATWTIIVPARFSARVDAHDGSVRISGLTAGVEASVNAGLRGRRGSLDVDVPSGRLNLTMGVGEITAKRRSSDFSSAVVRSTVGDAELFLLGHEIVAPRKPGPGHRVSLDGRGPDTLSLKVSVGDVSLKIG